jgi:hypothetical protein
VLTGLDGTRGADGRVHLVVRSSISGSIKDGDILYIAWNVLRDGRSIARHIAQVPATKLRTGARADEWVVPESLGGSVEFAAHVSLTKWGDIPDSASAAGSKTLALK